MSARARTHVTLHFVLSSSFYLSKQNSYVLFLEEEVIQVRALAKNVRGECGRFAGSFTHQSVTETLVLNHRAC